MSETGSPRDHVVEMLEEPAGMPANTSSGDAAALDARVEAQETGLVEARAQLAEITRLLQNMTTGALRAELVQETPTSRTTTGVTTSTPRAELVQETPTLRTTTGVTTSTPRAELVQETPTLRTTTGVTTGAPRAELVQETPTLRTTTGATAAVPPVQGEVPAMYPGQREASYPVPGQLGLAPQAGTYSSKAPAIPKFMAKMKITQPGTRSSRMFWCPMDV